VIHPEPATRPVVAAGPGAIGTLLAQVALGTAGCAIAAGLLGASIGISTGNLTAGILIRGVPTLLLVLLICRAVTARSRRMALTRPTLVVGSAAVLGFLLDPLTWEARTALTQLAVDPGPVTLIGDLLLWLLAAGLGIHLGGQGTAVPVPAATPYG
jgi:hypothetical protein